MKMISDILFLIYGATGLIIAVLYKLTEGTWNPAILMFSGAMLLFGIFYYSILKQENLTEW